MSDSTQSMALVPSTGNHVVPLSHEDDADNAVWNVTITPSYAMTLGQMLLSNSFNIAELQGNFAWLQYASENAIAAVTARIQAGEANTAQVVNNLYEACKAEFASQGAATVNLAANTDRVVSFLGEVFKGETVRLQKEVEDLKQQLSSLRSANNERFDAFQQASVNYIVSTVQTATDKMSATQQEQSSDVHSALRALRTDVDGQAATMKGIQSQEELEFTQLKVQQADLEKQLAHSRSVAMSLQQSLKSANQDMKYLWEKQVQQVNDHEQAIQRQISEISSRILSRSAVTRDINSAGEVVRLDLGTQLTDLERRLIARQDSDIARFRQETSASLTRMESSVTAKITHLESQFLKEMQEMKLTVQALVITHNPASPASPGARQPQLAALLPVVESRQTPSQSTNNDVMMAQFFERQSALTSLQLTNWLHTHEHVFSSIVDPSIGNSLKSIAPYGYPVCKTEACISNLHVDIMQVAALTTKHANSRPAIVSLIRERLKKLQKDREEVPMPLRTILNFGTVQELAEILVSLNISSARFEFAKKNDVKATRVHTHRLLVRAREGSRVMTSVDSFLQEAAGKAPLVLDSESVTLSSVLDF